MDSHRNPPAESVILSNSPRASVSSSVGPGPGDERNLFDSSSCASKERDGASVFQNPRTPPGIPIRVKASTSCRQDDRCSAAFAASSWSGGRMSAARSSQRASRVGTRAKRRQTVPSVHSDLQLRKVAMWFTISSPTASVESGAAQR